MRSRTRPRGGASARPSSPPSSSSARGRTFASRPAAFVAGVPDRTLPLARLAQAAVRSKTLGSTTGEPGLNACTWFYPDTVTWAFGGQACAVEVDVETCHVRLLRHVVLHDPGRAINPAIVEGPLQGGAA